MQLNRRNILALIVFLILLISIPVSLFLIKKQQILKSKAGGGGSRIEIYDLLSNLITGGITTNNNVKVKLIYEGGTNPSPSTLQPPLKQVKLAVILTKFQDTPADPYPLSSVKSVIFDSATSVKKYYEEVSFGQLAFSGDILGWYTLSDNGANNCLPRKWATDAEQIAKNNGVDLSKYTHFLFFFPLSVCAEVGEQGAVIDNIGDPKLWSKLLDRSNIVHELGHSFGLAHATSLKCGNLPIDDYSRCDDLNLTARQYGDPGDVMGGFATLANTPRDFNAPHKIALGFIPTSNIQTVTQNGTYTLSPLETLLFGTQVIRIIKKDTNESYYLEYRQPIGDFDKDLSPGLTRGVTVHIWDGQADHFTKLIDTTPGSCTPNPLVTSGCNTSDFSDAALSDGSSFTDPVNKITITQINHNNESATITVKLN